MSAAISRRDALRRAALTTGALTTAGLLAPALARAQSDDEVALRDFLAEAIGLSQIALLAYANALDQPTVKDALRTELERLRDQDQAHANALRKALDSLGYDPPDAPDSPDDAGVFDDVEGIDGETATELKERLAELGDVAGANERIDAIVALERAQIDFYAASAPGLPGEDLAITSAEIVGSLSQHVLALEVRRGADPAELVSGFAGGRGSPSAPTSAR